MQNEQAAYYGDYRRAFVPLFIISNIATCRQRRAGYRAFHLAYFDDISATRECHTLRSLLPRAIFRTTQRTARYFLSRIKNGHADFASYDNISFDTAFDRWCRTHASNAHGRRAEGGVSFTSARANTGSTTP